MSKEPLNPAQQFILDHLRDPFTHSSLVIASFKIIVGLFVQQRMETGKVLCDSSLPPTFLQQRNLSKQKPFYQLRIMIDILRQSAQTTTTLWIPDDNFDPRAYGSTGCDTRSSVLPGSTPLQFSNLDQTSQ
ncbi:hypothetical protein PSTG_00504 [Puccinia striiformis f. sp. tritici PST-78]|uniref:Uncharacterized protein n=1 Tax=Puccinia striiformis f. sp. tritici PST-78 TaxID=1165861 RepID=A0A0L0W5T9_9BASI|nr:hypothetical protein PSTG_00504 [Puccinia striiformis f. sp. tritici PST-78]